MAPRTRNSLRSRSSNSSGRGGTNARDATNVPHVPRRARSGTNVRNVVPPTADPVANDQPQDDRPNPTQATLTDVMNCIQGLTQLIHGLVPQGVPQQHANPPVDNFSHTTSNESSHPAAHGVRQKTDDGGVKMDEFLRLQPPIFSGSRGKEDPQAFIDQTQRIFSVMHCPSWRSVELASFRLQGVAYSWFGSVMTDRGTDQQMEWDEFKTLFLDRFLPESVREARAREFEALNQGNMSVAEYADKFTDLSAYAPYLVPTEERRIRRFISGLRYSIFRSISSASFSSLTKVVDAAQILEDRDLLERGAREQRKRPRENDNVENQHGGRQSQSHSQTVSQPRSGPLGDKKPFCQKCHRYHGGVCFRDTRGCHRCGQLGHYKNECPMRGAQLQNLTAHPTYSHPSVVQSAVPVYYRVQDTPTATIGQGAGVEDGHASGQVGPSHTHSGNERAQGRVFALTPQDAQGSNVVATGTLKVFNCDAYVLFDAGATHSFLSSRFASLLPLPPTHLEIPLEVSAPFGDHVFLRVSPMKGVMRFGKKGKLSPRFVGPFEVLARIGNVAYKLALPPALSNIHPVFHVSMLRKYVADSNHVLEYAQLQVNDTLSYEEEPVAVIDRRVKRLRNKDISSVKVLWKKSFRS